MVNMNGGTDPALPGGIKPSSEVGLVTQRAGFPAMMVDPVHTFNPRDRAHTLDQRISETSQEQLMRSSSEKLL